MKKIVLCSKRIICMLMTMMMLLSTGITAIAEDSLNDDSNENNESYDFVYQGKSQNGTQHNDLCPCLMQLKGLNNEIAKTYCVDFETEIDKNSKYSRCDVEDSNYYSDENAAHIRAIVRNSYPFITINDLRKKSSIPRLSESEAITGTQLAIWHFSNGKNFWFNFGEKDVEKLYKWLLSLKPINNPSTGIASIDIQSSVKQVGDKANIDMYYKPDSTNADGSPIDLKYEFDKDIKALYNATIEPTFVDENGYTHLHVKNLPLSCKFNFKVYATQNVKFDAYFYNPLGGRDKSQSLIGAHVGNTNISNSIDIAYEFPRPGSLNINKLDELTLKGIDGVKFELSDSRNFDNILYSIETDKTGTATINALTPGTWYIRESKAHEGYIPCKEILTIDIDSGEHATIDLKNTPYGNLNILKVDDDSNPIEGVAFSLYLGENIDEQCLLYENLLTDKNGNLVINNLQEGKYTLVETAVPKGYHINTTPTTVDITNGNTTKIKLTNKKAQPSSIGIIKLDQGTKNQLAGAVFSIYSDENFQNLVAQVTSLENAPAIVDNLAEGTYYIKESEAPNGYLLDAKPQVIKLSEGETRNVYFYDTKDYPTAGNFGIYLLLGGCIVSAGGILLLVNIKNLKKKSQE